MMIDTKMLAAGESEQDHDTEREATRYWIAKCREILDNAGGRMLNRDMTKTYAQDAATLRSATADLSVDGIIRWDSPDGTPIDHTVVGRLAKENDRRAALRRSAMGW